MTYYRLEQIRGIDRCLEKVLAVRREGRAHRQPSINWLRPELHGMRGRAAPATTAPSGMAPLANVTCCSPWTLATDRHSCQSGPAARHRTVRGHVTSIVTAPVMRALEFHSNFYQHRYSWRAPLLGMK